MIRAVAFVFVLQLTVSLSCENTTNDVTRFYEPSKFSAFDLLDSNFNFKNRFHFNFN